MGKDDAPAPERPPAKRRALERCPDVSIAVWAGDEALTPSERRRAQDERDRRKHARQLGERRVGIIHDEAGVTAEQIDAIRVALAAIEPTEIHHAGVQRGVHWASRNAVMGKVVNHSGDERKVLLNAQTLIIAPRSANQDSPAWDHARAGRLRGVALQIVMPDGEVLTGIPHTHNRRAS